MWPPTIVGRRARSPKVTARTMLSGSQTTSSSMHITYVDRPASRVSSWAAGEAAGAADVALLDDPELVAERLSRGREVLRRRRPSGCPARRRAPRRGAACTPSSLADLGEQLGAEVRPVHGGDADGDGAGLGPVGGHVGDPARPPRARRPRRRRRRRTSTSRRRRTASATGRSAKSLAARSVGRRRVDALRAAVGHRAVDDDAWRRAPVTRDVQGDVVTTVQRRQ